MTLKWWQEAIFYQIYPRSFADGNNDGIGDFIGIIGKLDYLRELGIDAIWLSPHFPSSNWDVGYDIKDYCDVGSEYGTLDDFKTFLHEAHKRNIRVILDLVANHTSDEHPWFLESRSSRHNPKSDWYVWVDTPPNNWQSCFDGDAWTYCPERDQYYYHFFMKQQPDLNWHNPKVVEAMWDVVRFWLNLGVDGYRLDAIATIYEDPNRTPHNTNYTLAELRNLEIEAVSIEQKEHFKKIWNETFKYQVGQTGVHDRMKDLRKVLEEYEGDRMLVGEDDDPAYMGNGDDELHLVFNFPLMERPGKLSPNYILENQSTRLGALAKISPDVWPCNTLGNHDRPRSYNHFGDGVHDAELARLSISLLMSLKGTPFLYNGEEIGMTDLMITDPSQFRDTMATWYYDRMIDGAKISPDIAIKRAAAYTRDKNRTPMQWSSKSNGGFSPANVQTWLPMNPNFKDGINVEDQQDDPNSLLSFYKKIIHIRKSNRALIDGDYNAYDLSDQEVVCFRRSNEQQSVVVLLNYSSQKQKIALPTTWHRHQKIVFSSAGRTFNQLSVDSITLGAFEVLILDSL